MAVWAPKHQLLCAQTSRSKHMLIGTRRGRSYRAASTGRPATIRTIVVWFFRELRD
jgi:hypothetical protein